MGMTARSRVVFLMIAAWILLCNHCALGLSGTTADPNFEPGECPMHSTPAKKKPVGHVPCCKELRAVVAGHAAKSVATLARQLVCEQDYVALVFVAPLCLMLRVAPRGTGPPGALSFAEAVLQRSVLAHAPPSVFDRV